MFNNNVINGVHETRYIASWVKAGGILSDGKDYRYFRKWLISLGLTEDEARHIANLAANGKLELENSAEAFIKNNK